MTLTIPYEHTAIELNTCTNGELEIILPSSREVTQLLFDQIISRMSYDDIINAITPQSFEQIMEHYQTEYKEEQHDYSINRTSREL